ncbi:MAG: 5,6-dimethylbenzimidazole synthase, partial [Pseudaminobacter sp.]|nr:5,6-dimethylbenzimidazole synthase [Pseudaminobacter sp.]
LDQQALKEMLRIPEHAVPVAYLCVGRVSEFAPKPDLESRGWAKRLRLCDLIMSETFSGPGETALKEIADLMVASDRSAS